MNETLKFTSGGNLGDFILALMGVKALCDKHNTKADIFLTSEPFWWYGLETTYNELVPIMKEQHYINSFVMGEAPNTGHVYDLNGFRNSPLLYSKIWSEIFSNLLQYERPKAGAWLSYHKDPSFSDKVIINRNTHNMLRVNPDFPYKKILDTYGDDNVLFVSSKKEDYDLFPFNFRIKFHQVSSLHEWFIILNSAKLFVGNLSAPGAIRTAFELDRINELSRIIDAFHWIGEEKYSDKVSWFYSASLNTIKI